MADTTAVAEAPASAPADETIPAAALLADPALADPAEETPETPTSGDKSEHAKEQSRRAFELRQKAKLADELQKELEGYKRREEEARKAKLTEEQRLREERDEAVARAARLEGDILKAKVAAEFKLPPALISRLIGTDEVALRADAEELARLLPRPRVGSVTDPAKETTGPPTYTREQLRQNPKLAAEIMPRYRRGEVTITE